MKRIITLSVIAIIGLAARGFATHSTLTTSGVPESAALTAPEAPALSSAPAPDPGPIKITARKFDFEPATVTVKKGQAVTLELNSADRVHGFSLPDFKITRRIEPGRATTVTFTPDKTGEFAFSCNVFCGSGHEDMAGKIVVTD